MELVVFWGVEAAFRKLSGVKETAVGYAGGQTASATYREVCTGTTGHAEVVQVDYDPKEISYEQLLGTFWSCHNPTQLNRQGPDVGTQYRSAIFYHSPAQQQAAEKSKAALDQSDRYTEPVATLIEPAAPFIRAEDYHQQYLEKQGLDRCHF